jgi:hypothetical protein
LNFFRDSFFQQFGAAHVNCSGSAREVARNMRFFAMDIEELHILRLPRGGKKSQQVDKSRQKSTKGDHKLQKVDKQGPKAGAGNGGLG